MIARLRIGTFNTHHRTGTPTAFACLLVVAVAAVWSTDVCGQDRKKLELADLIEQAEPACVRIDVQLKDGSQGIGSGFVVDVDRKWVVTNYHVVADSETATVIFEDGAKATVKGWNAHYTDKDLALLKIDTDRKLIALPLAQKLPRKGEKTVAIGAPQGLSFTATEGIVSAIRDGQELAQFSEYADEKDPAFRKFLFTGQWLQTSTPISPGSSGGPLLNMYGEVVGVNSGTLASGQNINFAVSCVEIQKLVNVGRRIRLRELSILTPSPAAGRPSKPTMRAKDGAIIIRIPSERRFRHRYMIENEEDEFDKITVLRSQWLPVKHDNRNLSSLGVRVSVIFDDDEVIPLTIWEVGTTARGFQFLGRDVRFQILGGEQSYELPQGRAERKLNGFVASEVMKGLSTLDAFVRVVLEDKVKARLGDTEMEFEKAQIECLRDLASQVPTGEFYDGKLKIERLTPADDPTNSRRR